jgi:GAF domain-containing protein
MTEPEPALGRLAALVTALGPALAPPGHDEALDGIPVACRAAFSAASCSVAVVDDAEETLRYVAADGQAADAVVGMELPLGTGIAGWVVASGQALGVSDVARDPRFARDVAERIGYVPTTMLALPLLAGDDVVGVLSILDPTPQENRDDFAVAAAFARQAALLVSQAAAFRQLGRTLLRALATATDDDDFAALLLEHAASTKGAQSDLARLAAAIHGLRALGPAEQRLATDLVVAVAAYAQRVRSRR